MAVVPWVAYSCTDGDVPSVGVAPVCFDCGNAVPAGQNFCGVCGHDLRSDVDASLDGVKPMLFREGVEGVAVTGSPGEAVTVRFPPAGYNGEAAFYVETDKYVLLAADGSGIIAGGCPQKRRGLCMGRNGRGCDDLAGWLGYVKDGTAYVCAGLCRGDLKSGIYAT